MEAVLECVGKQESMMQAIGSTRPGGSVGYVGPILMGGTDIPTVLDGMNPAKKTPFQLARAYYGTP